MPVADIDITNRCAVGASGAQIRILMPRHRFSAAEALVHAAWLVTIAEAITPGSPTFDQVLEAVRRGD